jgi:hypothetical protein
MLRDTASTPTPDRSGKDGAVPSEAWAATIAAPRERNRLAARVPVGQYRVGRRLRSRLIAAVVTKRGALVTGTA